MTEPVRSMTGFGRAVSEDEGDRIEVEIRSVNHKHLKISKRLPDALSPWDLALERLVKERLERGSIRVEIRHRRETPESTTRLDAALVRRLAEELCALRAEMGAGRVEPVRLELLCQLPGALIEEDEPKASEEEWNRVAAVCREALDELVASREAEGAQAREALEGHLDGIAEAVRSVQEGKEEVSRRLMANVRERVSGLLEGEEAPVRDEDVAREVAFLAERADVSEELNRLEGHVESMRETLARGGAVGRQCGFIAQEMLREANTTGAKLQDMDLVNRVLEAKMEVSKIREQVQNIE